MKMKSFAVKSPPLLGLFPLSKYDYSYKNEVMCSKGSPTPMVMPHIKY